MEQFFIFSIISIFIQGALSLTCLETTQLWTTSQCCNSNLNIDLSAPALTTLMSLVYSSGSQTITNGITCGQIQSFYNDNCGCSILDSAEISQGSKNSIYAILISTDSPTASPTTSAPTKSPTAPTFSPTEQPTAMPSTQPTGAPTMIPEPFIADKTMLTAAIDKAETDTSFYLQKYGEMSTWDISRVVDMSFAFSSWQLFDIDISAWDVKHVTNMDSMFLNTVFNQDISNWNVGAVTNVDSMFEGSSFNQPIGIWDMTETASRSISADAMFKTNNVFFQDLTSWINIVPPNTNELYSNSLMASAGGCDASGPAICSSGFFGAVPLPPMSLPQYSIVSSTQAMTICQQPEAPNGTPWTKPASISIVGGKTYYQCMQLCTDSSTSCTGFLWGQYSTSAWQTIHVRRNDLWTYSSETLVGHCELYSGQIGEQSQNFIDGAGAPGGPGSSSDWYYMVEQNSWWRGSCTIRSV